MSADQELRVKPLQVPLLHAFREAAAAGDSRKAEDVRADGDARVLTQRGSVRRRGANEAELRRNLDIDLGNLVNTVNLGSCIDLEGLDHVRGSVLNYGIADMTHMTMDALAGHDLAGALREALLRHEPRLIGDTIDVRLNAETDEINQRIAFEVTADMACRPVDIPLEFLAELDVGSGKVRLRKLADALPAPRRPDAP